MIVEFFHQPPAFWDAFIMKHTQGRLYHLSAWNEMIRNTFGHTVKYMVVREGGEILTALPITHFHSRLFGVFGVSLPFVNYGGPVSVENTGWPSGLETHLQTLRGTWQLEFIEIRLDRQIETSLPQKQHKVTFLLDLPDDPENLFKSFKAKLRSQIRRPLKEDMYARTGGMDLLEDFYRVFAINMRDLGTPVYPKSFFRNILAVFPDNAHIVVVYSREGKPVAGSFLITFKGIIEIPWASSLRKYNRYSPNMLLYWESMKLGIEKGCRQFDFGRCTPGVGTYRFKKQWGAREVPLFWYYVLPEAQSLPEMSPENSRFDLAIKVWRHLPIQITNIIGPLIIRHIP
ncbi:MAG: FemAB family PEP-CTERM system-associated protein [Calditrichaeota bacterium]|nr:MAG: FemAB family PEP-CTERM system-associated protein [Calditrichota bacterium]